MLIKIGILSQKPPLGGKATAAPVKPASVISPGKRAAPSMFDEFDSENVDPSTFTSPSKKSKHDGFNFTLTPTKSMPPPSFLPSSSTQTPKANMSSLRAPLTAPAGRSPKRKNAGINKTRRVSAPFTRIDPPSFSRSGGVGGLPFSLDAALNGTLSKPAADSNAGKTIQESMPKSWFFEIYEDTPEEEAANLMEHSTLTLDISSDEESSKKARDDRGKENTPPEGYDAPAASRLATAVSNAAVPSKKDIIRKKIVKADDMEDGERSPLSDLETEPFIPEGLTADAHFVVDVATSAETASGKQDFDIKALLAAPATAFSTGSTKKAMLDVPVLNFDRVLKGDIIVWEDTDSKTATTSTATVDGVETGSKRKRAAEDDENADPENAVPA